MVVLVTVCCLTGLAPDGHAQALSTGVNDRIDAAGVDTPAVSADQSVRQDKLDLEATLSAAYDDNVFLSKQRPEKDMVYRVSPLVAYSHGDSAAGLGAFLKFAYRPTAVFYSKLDSEDRIDHQAAVIAGWNGKISRLTYKGAFQKLGDATADTGREADRIEFENEIRAGWIPRDRLAVEFAGGQRETDYEDKRLFDSSKVYGETAVRFAYSPKTELGLAWQIGRFDVDRSGTQHTQQITATFNWKPREKIIVHLMVGGERRETDVGTDVNPVVENRIEWMPRQGTSLFLASYQRQEASAYLAGQNYQARGLSAGISQRLGSRWTARFEGGLETASYNRVSGAGGSGRKDEIWFVRPEFEYQVSDSLDVSLFYRLSDNDSSDPNFGFRQSIAGVEMNYRF